MLRKYQVYEVTSSRGPVEYACNFARVAKQNDEKRLEPAFWGGVGGVGEWGVWVGLPVGEIGKGGGVWVEGLEGHPTTPYPDIIPNPDPLQ